jgi:hypothetical protein
MKIKCNDTSAVKLKLSEVNTITSNEFDYKNLGLLVGEIYLVMAMILYKDTKYLYYLIDINGKPNWFPNELFEVTDNSLPTDWSFRIFNDQNDVDIYCIWGYDEICNNEEHYDQLIERENEALMIYFNNKRKIEEQMGQ